MLQRTPVANANLQLRVECLIGPGSVIVSLFRALRRLSATAVPLVHLAFLATHDPVLVKLAALGKRYFSKAPNSALIKICQLAETLAKGVAALAGITPQ